jgi:hypothetical protein
MWPWQHKNIHKRHLLWAKLFSVCFFFHLIFLLWILCVYRDNTYTFSISLNKKIDFTIPIVFKPAYVKTVIDKPCTAPTQAVPATVKPIIPKTVATPKIVQKKESTMIADRPKTPPVIKKPEVKAAPAETKPKAEPAKIIPTPQSTPAPAKKVIPDNAQICDNYKEVEALRRHAQLHNEVVKQWKPPCGVPPTCACDISFFVNARGKIENLTIEKSSGVIIYDISARQALHLMTMPQWTHGKQLIINFK